MPLAAAPSIEGATSGYSDSSPGTTQHSARAFHHSDSRGGAHIPTLLATGLDGLRRASSGTCHEASIGQQVLAIEARASGIRDQVKASSAKDPDGAFQAVRRMQADVIVQVMGAHSHLMNLLLADLEATTVRAGQMLALIKDGELTEEIFRENEEKAWTTWHRACTCHDSAEASHGRWLARLGADSEGSGRRGSIGGSAREVVASTQPVIASIIGQWERATSVWGFSRAATHQALEAAASAAVPWAADAAAAITSKEFLDALWQRVRSCRRHIGTARLHLSHLAASRGPQEALTRLSDWLTGEFWKEWLEMYAERGARGLPSEEADDFVLERMAACADLVHLGWQVGEWDEVEASLAAFVSGGRQYAAAVAALPPDGQAAVRTLGRAAMAEAHACHATEASRRARVLGQASRRGRLIAGALTHAWECPCCLGSLATGVLEPVFYRCKHPRPIELGCSPHVACRGCAEMLDGWCPVCKKHAGFRSAAEQADATQRSMAGSP
ncbi:unnamed protein product [Pedinophyceae sp. YPF-701]|nr:unnamed protein product [Pedinophyceae sp. YPF-701]